MALAPKYVTKNEETRLFGSDDNGLLEEFPNLEETHPPPPFKLGQIINLFKASWNYV
jgi:hypothetical protein